MKIAKILPVVLLITLCGCNGFVGNTATHSDSTIKITDTPTIAPVPTFTSTPYPEHDALYFWWWDGNKNKTQLWEIAPQGTSTILYEFTDLLSLEEALNAGLLTENDVKKLQQPAVSDPNLLKSEADKIDIFPESLQLSPDRSSIAWHEKVRYYCIDIYTCMYGTIIRVLNIEDRKLEISISIPVEQETFAPVWSPDSQKLAYYTKQRDPDTTNNIIHILDIDTATTIDIAGGNNDFAWTLAWMPDSSGIVFGNIDGLHMLVLEGQEIKHIFSDDNWWIFDIVVSPNRNSIAFTGIKDFDDPITTPRSDNMDYSHQFIYVFDLNADTLQSIISANERGWIRNIYWLPDGQHFVYAHELSHTEIFIRDLTSNEIIITETLPFNVDNDWDLSQLSKDGNKMLFMSSEYDEATTSLKTSLIAYDLNIKAWNKVPLPAEIQNAMDENTKNILLRLATW